MTRRTLLVRLFFSKIANLVTVMEPMNDVEMLDEAIAIAVEAHRGQMDRYGAPYILHALRVMNRLHSPLEQTVGVLHDVVEDTDWTFEGLAKEGFPKEVIEALKAVTKHENEDYEKFVQRSASNPLAKKIKLADLEDNMDLRRMHEVTEKDLPRLQKYVKAWNFLSEIK
jgi:(p)ppGpp synthase/HD superfamily hydrolase